MRKLMLALALLAVSLGSAHGSPDTDSGNYMLKGCQEFMDDNFQGNRFNQGKCVGVIATILILGDTVCQPQEAARGQAIMVVINSLERHPETLHRDFRDLAIDALAEAWPCK
jgi:hypothetical protein